MSRPIVFCFLKEPCTSIKPLAEIAGLLIFKVFVSDFRF
jgi:hypothetical protein